MAIDAATLERNKRVLTRGGLLVLLLAALLFLPSPNGNLEVMLFDSLLLTIFAMLVVGTTGPASLYVTLSAFMLTVGLPVLILTLSVRSDSGGLLPAFQRVLAVLTEPDPMEGFYLLVPTLVAAAVSLGLGRARFRLRGY
jgi:hypothetical protein